jgi:hypothetical protein
MIGTKCQQFLILLSLIMIVISIGGIVLSNTSRSLTCKKVYNCSYNQVGNDCILQSEYGVCASYNTTCPKKSTYCFLNQDTNCLEKSCYKYFTRIILFSSLLIVFTVMGMYLIIYVLCCDKKSYEHLESHNRV